MENMFEKAARLKLRFKTSLGSLSVEDLYDLPLTSTAGKPNLDDIAKSIHREVRSNAETTSFVNPNASSAGNEVLNLKLEIVKHVIGVLVVERDQRETEKTRREEKQKILALIDRKKNEALEGKSLDELTEMLNKL